MGHYWSEMASDDDFRRHEETIRAAQHKSDVKAALHTLGEYLVDHPTALHKLIEMLGEEHE